jgi:hypothetical protein
MKTGMLNFCKTILKKVSFDHRLFKKEYGKCLGYLDGKDRQKLTVWVSLQDLSEVIPGNREKVK